MSDSNAFVFVGHGGRVSTPHNLKHICKHIGNIIILFKLVHHL